MKQVLSDYYIQDASFYRIDNITLGWSFAKSKVLPLGGRIYSSVQNPLVFTKYKGLDPEVFGGVDNDFYPRPLTIMLGVNLNF
jgi:iron complex outermembrane receptor protein